MQEELEAAQKELGAERAASATLRRQVLLSVLTSIPALAQHASCRKPPHTKAGSRHLLPCSAARTAAQSLAPGVPAGCPGSTDLTHGR